MKKEFDVYLFDFDGTLINSYNAMKMIFIGAYNEVGIKIEDSIITYLMRTPLPVAYNKIRGNFDQWDTFAMKIIELLNSDESVQLTNLYDDTASAINALLKLGKRIGIVTSNNLRHVYDVLDHLSIDKESFSVFVGNQEVKNHKPSPDPILKALELLNIDKNNVCYVGDAMDDVQSSCSAGITPILLDRDNEYDDYRGLKINKLSELYD